MNHQRNFIYSPGGEHETGNTTPTTNEDLKDTSTPVPLTNEDAQKPVLEKIKDALREWSNKDEQDQAFDDTRV